ncbi:MAG: AsnC family protein [Hahellaceae bacterium]|nr:AsnC family protein [Hahellaceae bacterium]
MNQIAFPGLNEREQERLKAAIQDGLPLCPQPWLRLANDLGLSEAQVMHQVQLWTQEGMIKRMGLVVRHHALGYRANAMVVWNVPEDAVDALGERLRQSPYVNLCYRRRRQLPDWPYNLYCMIHGKDRAAVKAQIQELILTQQLQAYPHAILFSNQQFKQTGGHYARCAH